MLVLNTTIVKNFIEFITLSPPNISIKINLDIS